MKIGSATRVHTPQQVAMMSKSLEDLNPSVQARECTRGLEEGGLARVLA